jgi:hypothetical protein
MSGTVSGILNYVPEPDPETHARQVRWLWIAAAISLSMAAIGYIILAIVIL